MQWKSMLIPEQTLTLPAPPKRPLPWLLLPCLIAEEPSPRCHLPARRDPIKGLMLRCVEDSSFFATCTGTRYIYRQPYLRAQQESWKNRCSEQEVFPTPQFCFHKGSLPAPFPSRISGVLPTRPFRLNFLWKTPRQVFLSASGLWLAVLFTLVIFLVAAMLARYVTSKGEKEQMENVDSAPTAKEAPGIFQTKRRRGRFFFCGWVCFSMLGRHSHLHFDTIVRQIYGTTQKWSQLGHSKSSEMWHHRGRRLSTSIMVTYDRHVNEILGLSGYILHIPQLSPIPEAPFQPSHDSTLIPDLSN